MLKNLVMEGVVMIEFILFPSNADGITFTGMVHHYDCVMFTDQPLKDSDYAVWLGKHASKHKA